jgi:hypothetical protein
LKAWRAEGISASFNPNGSLHLENPMETRFHVGLLLVLFLILTGSLSPASAQDPHPVQGHWVGAIEFPGEPLDAILDLIQEENGLWAGTISIPAQVVEDFPVSRLVVEGNQVSFSMGEMRESPRFQGQISTDGRTMTGTFIQVDVRFPFRLTKEGD